MLYVVEMYGRKKFVICENNEFRRIEVGDIITKKGKKYIVKKIRKKSLKVKRLKEKK